MKNRATSVIFVALVTLVATTRAQDLVDWRGSGRTGIYEETGLLKEWPEAGPTMLWSVDGLGQGFTSATIVNDMIYTTGQIDGVGYLFALDKKGNVLWKKPYGKEWSESYPGTRTTPVYYDGKLYLETAMCEALCLDPKTGDKIWSVDLAAKYGARKLTFGFVEAPVISDNKVIFTPGGPSVTMVALDRSTGAEIWKTDASGEQAAYCSPLLFDYKGTKYLATSLTKNVACVDVNTGKPVWEVSQVNRTAIHPNTPIIKGNMMYSVTGYGTGGVMIKIADDGLSATDLWRNTSLDSQIGGAVWVGNYIVGSGSQNDRSWQALDAQTGQVKYSTKEIGKGVVIYADGLYYCYADNGEMGIMELTDAGFKLKSKFRITLGTDQHWAYPVIEKSILYIRHGNTLMAYSIKK
jgi:outer membrane protein assembly factor BamB